MRRKNILFFLFIINLLIACSVLATKGSANDYNTQVIYSSKDSYVYNKYPDKNYGDLLDMECGNFEADCICDPPLQRRNFVYIYFDLNAVTQGWEKVYLSLNIRNIPKPFELDLGIVNEQWDEHQITWNNQPSNIAWEVKSLDLTTNKTYLFDISELISSPTLEFNIILYDQHIEEKINVLINSKENVNHNFRPQLIFFSQQSPEIEITHPYLSSTWEVDKTYNIEWNSRGDVFTVYIELYKDNNLKYQFGPIPNIGSYPWFVPKNCENGTGWSIKIYDANNSSIFDWSPEFEIYNNGSDGKGNNQFSIPSYSVGFIILIFGCLIGLVYKGMNKSFKFKQDKLNK